MKSRIERVAGAPALLGLRYGPFDIAAIVRAGAALGHVGAVDRKRGDHLFERRQHAAERKVARAPVADRQAMEAAGEHIHLARQIDPHDPLLRGVQHLVEAFVTPGQTAVQAGHRRLGTGIDEQRQRLVDEIVAGRAGDRPIRQALVARQDLLDDDIGRIAGALAQCRAILRLGRTAHRCGRSAALARSRARPSSRTSRCVASNNSGNSMRSPARSLMLKNRR